jgi:transcription elongation GreA/GreB family factor
MGNTSEPLSIMDRDTVEVCRLVLRMRATKPVDLTASIINSAKHAREHFGSQNAGSPYARAARSGSGCLWFITDQRGAKDSEIKAAPDVCLAFAETDSNSYLSITGCAEVLQDVAKATALWRRINALKAKTTGLAAMEAAVGRFEAAHRDAVAKDERAAVAAALREIRRWGARRACVEVVKPADQLRAPCAEVRAGTEFPDRGRADPSRGTVSYGSLLARALLNGGPGETVVYRPAPSNKSFITRTTADGL